MKTLLLASLALFSSVSHATVDANVNVYILSQEVQTGEYFVQKAPIIGCFGIAKGPELSQLTKPYVVNNLGCGMDSQENINALSCANVIQSVESDDYTSFKTITLDISKCADKSNDFIDAVKKVVKLNFTTKAVKPELILKQ